MRERIGLLDLHKLAIIPEDHPDKALTKHITLGPDLPRKYWQLARDILAGNVQTEEDYDLSLYRLAKRLEESEDLPRFVESQNNESSN